MIYLVALCLLLTSCLSASDIRHTEERDLKFNAGEEVRVSKGTYRGCEGYISSFSNYVDKDEPKVRYTISGVICNGKPINDLSRAMEYELESISKPDRTPECSCVKGTRND